jgi:hypothetical protein
VGIIYLEENKFLYYLQNLGNIVHICTAESSKTRIDINNKPSRMLKISTSYIDILVITTTLTHLAMYRKWLLSSLLLREPDRKWKRKE